MIERLTSPDRLDLVALALLLMGIAHIGSAIQHRHARKEIKSLQTDVNRLENKNQATRYTDGSPKLTRKEVLDLFDRFLPGVRDQMVIDTYHNEEASLAERLNIGASRISQIFDTQYRNLGSTREQAQRLALAQCRSERDKEIENSSPVVVDRPDTV